MIVKIGVLCGKIAFFIFLMMWIRWTLPRFRFDQIMRVAWKALIPMTLALFVLAVGLLYFGLHRSGWALVGNMVILVVSLLFAAFSRTPVTGRASNLPPIRKSAVPMTATGSEVTA